MSNILDMVLEAGLEGDVPESTIAPTAGSDDIDNNEVDDIEVEENKELDDANIAYESIDKAEKIILTMESAALGLEAIAKMIEADSVDGGVHPKGAKYLHAAINAHTSPFGMESNSIVPSVEAFGDRSSVVKVTTTSMEGLGDKITEFWDSIKKSLATLWKKIKDYYEKTWSSSARTAANAKAIAERAGAITTAPKEEKMKISAKLVAKVGINGKLSESNVDNLQSTSKSIMDTLIPNMVKWANDFSKSAMAINTSNDTKFNESMDSLLKVGLPDVKSLLSKDVSGKMAGNDKSTKTIASDLLMGDVVVALTQMTYNVNGGNVRDYLGAIQSMNIMVDQLPEAKKKSKEYKETEANVLSTNNMVRLADKTETMANSITDFKTKSNTVEKAGTGLKEAGDKLSKALSDADLSTDNLAVARKVLNALNKISMLIANLPGKYFSYLGNSLNAINEYNRKSLAKY